MDTAGKNHFGIVREHVQSAGYPDDITGVLLRHGGRGADCCLISTISQLKDQAGM
jgi:hypothetical protein